MDPDIQQLTSGILAIVKDDGQTKSSQPDLFGNLVLSLGARPTSIIEPDLNDSQKYRELFRRTPYYAVFPHIDKQLQVGALGLGSEEESRKCTRRCDGSALAAFGLGRATRRGFLFAFPEAW